MKYILYGVMSVVLVGCGGGSSLTLTQANLDKVHEGMSKAEVESILGQPTSSVDKPIPIVGGTETIYTYQNDHSSVTIDFKNDQEQSKTGSFN